MGVGVAEMVRKVLKLGRFKEEVSEAPNRYASQEELEKKKEKEGSGGMTKLWWWLRGRGSIFCFSVWRRIGRERDPEE